MKKILILSGTHGDEQTAIKAGMMLNEYFNKDKNVTVIPWLNKNALINNSREYQNDDSFDLNRVLTNEKGKNFSEIKKQLINEIKLNDYIIDIHNSPKCANFFLVDIDKNVKKICKILKKCEITYASRYSQGGTIKDYTNKLNKIGFTYEFTGMQSTDDKNIEKAYKDVLKLVKILKLGKKSKKFKLNKIREYYTPLTGFVDYYVESNDVVKENEILFTVLNKKNGIVFTKKAKKKIKILSLGNNFENKGTGVIMYHKIK